MKIKSAQTKEKFFEVLFLGAALISILAVLVICIFLFASGMPAMTEIGIMDFIFGTEWRPSSNVYGIFSMIVGSIYITAGSMVFGVPIGIMTAVFMAKFCPAWLYRYIKPGINLLAGIPSIIYGFFGMIALVPLIRDNVADGYYDGNSILTASILLGIMILPTVIGISESAIRAVPQHYYEGALALGATHERSVFSVVLPAAKSGVFASVVLAIGRSIGETMAVIMVAGNQARITGNPLLGIRTMTANVVIEMKYAADLHEGALIATGVVLFVFILIINLSFSLIKRRVNKQV